MGVILGIIGGGQLGMMLAEAAKNMPNEISKVIVLDHFNSVVRQF